MRNLLYIVVTTVILTACVGGGKERVVLDTAQRIINDRPDSALTMLDSLEPSSHDFSTENLRRWQLLRLMAQNKCDTVFSGDSLQKKLVKYYDRYGTPNERMTAHYLLGRAYSDMGEAPRALQCFLNAVACADTTSQECDFKTLFFMYGQMAMVFRLQCMPKEELAAWNQYSHFALKSGNMYYYIRGMEMTIGPYYDLGDTVSCLRITGNCHKEYMKHGMPQEAAKVFPSAIYIHLLNSNFVKAKEMMNVFERESGLFDSLGNIEKGRESYYYSKGLYYLGVQEYDSAEYYFRKLHGFHFNHDFQANKGLLSLYKKKDIIDSISKYAERYVNSEDELLNENQAEAVAQTATYYKYNRLQKESEVLAVKAEKSKWISRMLFILFLFIAVVSAYLFYLYKRKQKEKMEKLGIDYTNLMSKYRQVCHETEKIKSDKGEALREKENENNQLKSQLGRMKTIFEGLSPDMKKLALSKSDIVKKFRDLAIPKAPPVLPCQKDWKLLMETMEYTDPSLYGRIIFINELSSQEKYTCLLTMLNFSSGELTVLLDTSKQRVSNIKASANFKLFGTKDAKALLRNLESM